MLLLRATLCRDLPFGSLGRSFHRPHRGVAFDMLLDDMTLLAKTGHGRSRCMRQSAGGIDHIFKAGTSAGLKKSK